MLILRLTEKDTKTLDICATSNAIAHEGFIFDNENISNVEVNLKVCDYSGDTLYIISGYCMNRAFDLSGVNAYPDDFEILIIPKFYNLGYKIITGARWFSDIIASNIIKQNAVDTGLEADFQ